MGWSTRRRWRGTKGLVYQTGQRLYQRKKWNATSSFKTVFKTVSKLDVFLKLKVIFIMHNTLLKSALSLLALFGSPAALAQAALEPEAKELVVMVSGTWDGGNAVSQGAGIVFGAQSGRLYIATADHVVRPRANDFGVVDAVEVGFYALPGQGFPAEVLRPLEGDFDLAVLSVRVEDLGISASSFPFHRFGEDRALRRADQMFTVGQGSGRPWLTLLGAVNILESEEGLLDLQFSDVTPGDSGGGVFTEEGELIGMMLNINPPAVEVLGVDLLKAILAESRYPLGEVGEPEAPAEEAEGADPPATSSAIAVVPVSTGGDAQPPGTEACNAQNLCLTLSGYRFSSGGVGPLFTLENRGESPAEVRYRNTAFKITDDTGTIYEMLGSGDEKVQELAVDESVVLEPTATRNYTDRFNLLPYFGGVTGEEAREVYVDVSNFMDITSRWLLAKPNPFAGPSALTNDQTISLGEGFRANGLNIVLSGYSVGGGGVFLEFTITNVTDENILVRYRNTAFSVTDDTGKVYQQQGVTDLKQRLLEPGESAQIESTSTRNYTDGFQYLGMFSGVADEEAASLRVAVRSLMGLENLMWNVLDLNPHRDEPKTPNPLEPLGLREGYAGAGLSLSLSEVTVGSGRVGLEFTLRNESASPILVRYSNDALRVESSSGATLEQNALPGTKQRLVAPGDSVVIASTTTRNYTDGFDLFGTFALPEGASPETLEALDVTFERFMGLENLEWRVPLTP